MPLTAINRVYAFAVTASATILRAALLVSLDLNAQASRNAIAENFASVASAKTINERARKPMPVLKIYVDDDILRFLRQFGEPRGRTVESLAEAAVENAAYEAGFRKPREASQTMNRDGSARWQS